MIRYFQTAIRNYFVELTYFIVRSYSIRPPRMSRTIAIGDIHGCATALDRLLVEIQPTQEDTVIGIGDYVDRGMNSAGTLDILISLVGKTKFVPLIGNHELMSITVSTAKKATWSIGISMVVTRRWPVTAVEPKIFLSITFRF